MPRRRLALLVLAAVVAAVVVVLVVRGVGEQGPAKVADPLAEALSYVPASSEVVAAVDVQTTTEQGRAVRRLARSFPPARFVSDALRTSLRNAGFDPDNDVPVLLGGPLVVGGPSAALTAFAKSARGLTPDLGALLRTGGIATIVARDAGDLQTTLRNAADGGRLRKLPSPGTQPKDVNLYALPSRNGVLGTRDQDVVLGADAARVANAFMLHDRQAGLTRALFEQRLAGLPRSALVRLTAQPRVLIGASAHGVPWVDALRVGAATLRVERPGLRLQARLPTNAKGLRPQDLPLARGAAPPRPAPGGTAEWLGLRDASQTLRALDAAKGRLDVPALKGLLDALATLDRLKKPLRTFGRIDVNAALLDQLTKTTTFTRERTGWALRGELRDGGPLRSALRRLAAIPDFLLRLSGLTDLSIAGSGADTFEVRRKGATFLRVGVIGNVVVATSDLNASVRAIAARRPQDVPAKGALAFRLTGPAVQDFLVTRLGLPALARLVLGGFGDLDGSASAELDGVTIDATLALGS